MRAKHGTLECNSSLFSGAPRRDSRTTGAPGPAYGTYSVRNIYEDIPPPNPNPFTNSGVKVGQVRWRFFSAIVYICIYSLLLTNWGGQLLLQGGRLGGPPGHTCLEKNFGLKMTLFFSARALRARASLTQFQPPLCFTRIKRVRESILPSSQCNFRSSVHHYIES